MDLGEVAAVYKRFYILQLVDNQQEINGIVLGVVGHEIGDDFIN